MVIAAVPAIRGQNYIDFTYHMDKRGILTAVAQGRDELVRWDPISKIDVMDETFSPEIATPGTSPAIARPLNTTAATRPATSTSSTAT